MKSARLLALCFGLACLAMDAAPAWAAQAQRSAQDARADLILQQRVGADPSAQLYVAEALAALNHQAQADMLRRALVALWIRRIDGEAADPALTLGSLLQLAADAPPLVDGGATATAWQGAVARHVRLQFVDVATADRPPPADARAGTHQIASGLWVPAERMGSMTLFVRAHQDLPVPVPLGRLRLQWHLEQLTCTPAAGPASRQQDALLACEGPSHADKLPALANAITNARDRAVDGVVSAGEFDTPGSVSAWVDALAAGHDDELKRLLARVAPCEAERDAGRRCAWSGEDASRATDRSTGTSRAIRPALQDRGAPRSSPEGRSLLDEWIPKLGGWFFAGAIAMWFICGWLRSSSMLMECVVHVVATLALLFVAKWGIIIGWAAWVHQNQSEMLAGTAAAFAIFVALRYGIMVGATLHLMRRTYDWWLDNRGYS